MITCLLHPAKCAVIIFSGHGIANDASSGRQNTDKEPPWRIQVPCNQTSYTGDEPNGPTILRNSAHPENIAKEKEMPDDDEDYMAENRI